MSRKAKKHFFELKDLYKQLKEKNKNIKDEERFEDVSTELSDKDKEGRFFHNSYMDFYRNVKFNLDNNETIIPRGLSSTSKNYN
tara:strand:+ start:597 stop:848 length:252 start_codon:yes stop_codon:yes gene_type:complete